MGHSPKPPPPTQFDQYVRFRQTEDLNKLDALENRRKKAILRGRLGLRQLLTGDSSFALADAPNNYSPRGLGSRGRALVGAGGFSPGGGGGPGTGGGQFGGGRPPAQQ